MYYNFLVAPTAVVQSQNIFCLTVCWVWGNVGRQVLSGFAGGRKTLRSRSSRSSTPISSQTAFGEVSVSTVVVAIVLRSNIVKSGRARKNVKTKSHSFNK